jgi:hypothetical protein
LAASSPPALRLSVDGFQFHHVSKFVRLDQCPQDHCHVVILVRPENCIKLGVAQQRAGLQINRDCGWYAEIDVQLANLILVVLQERRKWFAWFIASVAC